MLAQRPPLDRSAMARARALVTEERGSVHVRLLVAMLVIRAFPLLTGRRLRAAVLRLGGVSIGRGSVLGGPVRIAGALGGAGVHIGASCVINSNCHLDVTAAITIGDNVGLGQEVMILTGTHSISSASERRLGELEGRAVEIGQGAWIGARAMLLPGVVIGEGAVVAAGAVVTRDVAADTLVAGVPARPIRKL